VRARAALGALVVEALLLLSGLFTGSCAIPPSNEAALLPDGPVDRRIEEACALTARTCTRCHDLNRVYVAHLDKPASWQSLVWRMRYMPSSNITDDDARVVTTCLVYRLYGQPGLDEIESLAPPQVLK
jgi:hypothetical protein